MLLMRGSPWPVMGHGHGHGCQIYSAQMLCRRLVTPSSSQPLAGRAEDAARTPELQARAAASQVSRLAGGSPLPAVSEPPPSRRSPPNPPLDSSSTAEPVLPVI